MHSCAASPGRHTMNKRMWKPLKDGTYIHDSIIDGRIKLTRNDDGESIRIDGPERGDWESLSLSPFPMGLCQRTTVEQEAGVSVPSGAVLYVMQKALERHRRRIDEVDAMGWYQDPSVAANENARIDEALAWLDTLTGAGG